MHVLITGHSRGLGAALCQRHLAAGDEVWGLSRGAAAHSVPGLHEGRCDLALLDQVTARLEALVPAETVLDRVYLNAGVLGRIANLRDTPLADLSAVMDINVWANKLVLDWLAARTTPVAEVVLVSSGAGVTGNHGWGAYALSKAALNMLAQLYAHEMPSTHLLALAPGLVDTDMQGLLRQVDVARFPSVARLQRAHGTPDMPDADTVAARIFSAWPRLRALPSGSFIDLRRL